MRPLDQRPTETPHTEAAARRFVLAALGTSLGSVLAAVAALLAADPTGALGTGLVPPLVESARSTKVRLLQAARGRGPVALVLGSSRTMKVRPAVVQALSGLPTINASVHSARAEDLLALLRFALEDAGLDVRLVVLGLERQMFHDGAGYDLRLLRSPALLAKLGKAPAPLPFSTRLAREFHRANVADAIRSLGFALTSRPSPKLRFEPDGFLVYPAWEQAIAAGTYDLAAAIRTSQREYLGRFSDFTALDAGRLARLRDLLDLCRARAIEVRVLLTGLHPDVEAVLAAATDAGRLQDDLRRALATLRHEYGFAFVDGSDLATYGGDPANFYDGAHVREENQRRLTRALFRGPSADAVP